MLKLIRNSREGKISIIVREKEFFITRPLAVAFTIALSIHLGLLLLFRIAPFTIIGSHHVFPPTSVEADSPTNESVIAEMPISVLTIRGLPNIPPASPVVLSEPLFLTVRPVEYAKAINTIDAFAQIEQVIYRPTFQPLMHTPRKPMELIVSGVLGQYPMIGNVLDNKERMIPRSNMDHKISYTVQVESKSGKVFWFELMHTTNSKEMSRFAEKMLREMQFDLDSNMLAVSGEIEFHFHQEIE